MLRGFGFGGPLSCIISSAKSSHRQPLTFWYLDMAIGSNVSSKKVLFFDTKFNCTTRQTDKRKS